jgi:hypothetical protein
MFLTQKIASDQGWLVDKPNLFFFLHAALSKVNITCEKIATDQGVVDGQARLVEVNILVRGWTDDTLDVLPILSYYLEEVCKKMGKNSAAQLIGVAGPPKARESPHLSLTA